MKRPFSCCRFFLLWFCFPLSLLTPELILSRQSLKTELKASFLDPARPPHPILPPLPPFYDRKTGAEIDTRMRFYRLWSSDIILREPIVRREVEFEEANHLNLKRSLLNRPSRLMNGLIELSIALDEELNTKANDRLQK